MLLQYLIKNNKFQNQYKIKIYNIIIQIKDQNNSKKYYNKKLLILKN